MADHLATGGSFRGIPLTLQSSTGHCIRTWVQNQRTDERRLRKYRLDRIARLESLPGWQWSLEAWDGWYDLIQRFVALHGHARVPQHEVFEERRLGSWVSNQRQLYRRKQLKRNQIRKLHALPGWLWDASLVSWQAACEDLAAFVDRFGHSAVPYTYRSPDDDFALGAWASRLRKLVTDGTLTSDRRQLVRAALAYETIVKPRSLSRIIRRRRAQPPDAPPAEDA